MTEPYLIIEKHSEAYKLLMEFRNKCSSTEGYPVLLPGNTPKDLLMEALRFANTANQETIDNLNDRIDELEGRLNDMDANF